MNSRMSKYNLESSVNSRVNKNEDLYKNLSKNDLNNFNVYNNTTILGENKKNEIDIESIKKILDHRYKDAPKRKSIRLDDTVPEVEKELEVTKEYNINTILNKAKNEKVSTYEEERFKKIKDTQFDILKNLKVEKESVEEEKNDNLMSLIQTITINETKKNNESEDLDLLSSLKGENDTELVASMKDTIIKQNIHDLKKDTALDKNLSSPKETKEDFYTSSTKFSSKDFEKIDIENGKRSIITEIIVILILIAFVIGLFIFFKSILNF